MEKKCKQLEKECATMKEKWSNEKFDLEKRLEESKKLNIDQSRAIEGQISKQQSDEQKVRIRDLETKLDKLIKEKDKLDTKCSQLIEKNKDLNELMHNKDIQNDKKHEDIKNKCDNYFNRCNQLEQQIAASEERHLKETEEWRKFQADLQTAVRVANDFMVEAEEKIQRVQEETQKESTKHLDEIERLKMKLQFYETAKSNYQNKKDKENNSSSTSLDTNPSIVRNLIDTIESTSSSCSSSSSVVLGPIELNTDPTPMTNTNIFKKTAVSSASDLRLTTNSFKQ
jgi:DNA repair exonuclease SbcCD ATPase subunit